MQDTKFSNYFAPTKSLPSIDRVSFIQNRLDRDSEHRDDDSVAAMKAHSAAAFYLFHDDSVLVRLKGDERLGLFSAKDAEHLGAEMDNAILLGTDPVENDAPRFAAPLREGAMEKLELTDGFALETVRDVGLLGLLAADQTGAIAQAFSLLNWNKNHQYCAKCGATTVVALGGARRDCPSCSSVHFPRTDPAAIMLAIHRDEAGVERCLLAHHARFSGPMYTTLAGFIEQGETLESAVRREVFEEAGIQVGSVRYLASQPWPFPSSLMLGCYAEALSSELTIDTTELTDARWMTREEVREFMSRDPGSEEPHIPGRYTIAAWLIRSWVEAEPVSDC